MHELARAGAVRADAGKPRSAPAAPAAAAGANRCAPFFSAGYPRRFDFCCFTWSPSSLFCDKAWPSCPPPSLAGEALAALLLRPLRSLLHPSLRWCGSALWCSASSCRRAAHRSAHLRSPPRPPHGGAATLWSCSRQLGALLLLHFLSTSHSSLGCSL